MLGITWAERLGSIAGGMVWPGVSNSSIVAVCTLSLDATSYGRHSAKVSIFDQEWSRKAI